MLKEVAYEEEETNSGASRKINAAGAIHSRIATAILETMQICRKLAVYACMFVSACICQEDLATRAILELMSLHPPLSSLPSAHSVKVGWEQHYYSLWKN